jgi:N-acetylmuramoyl-L-alanine amidase
VTPVREQRTATALVASLAAALVAASAARADNAQIAGLQVALRAKGVYHGSVDGVAGPETVAAVKRIQARAGLVVDGRAGLRTRAALGALGRPLLGRRPLARGAVGWDVSVLQFLLHRRGLLACEIDGTLGRDTVAAIRGFQSSVGLRPSGIAGTATLAALSRGGSVPLAPRQHSSIVYVVKAGDSLTAIAGRYRTTLAAVAKQNRLDPRRVLLVGKRLRITPGPRARRSAPARRTPVRATPARAAPTATYVVRSGDNLTVIASRYGTTVSRLARTNKLDSYGVLVIGTRLKVPIGSSSPAARATRAEIRASIDRWSAAYGVDPALARALAWMESGFQQHVVSSVGAVGVMQLLPETMEFVQTVLLGRNVAARTADGNIRLGVRLLAHLLREFKGDRRLALAAWYQGTRAVREHGVYKISEPFVDVVLALRGRV